MVSRPWTNEAVAWMLGIYFVIVVVAVAIVYM